MAIAPTNEKLILNTLAFDFPSKPFTFYFSMFDRDDIPLTPLNHQLFPVNIRKIFPDIGNNDTLYTSFERRVDGFSSLSIDFRTENFNLIKRYYNREIKHYFTSQGFLVEPTFINDNQIWLRSNETPKRRIKDTTLYDRFTLKVNFNQLKQAPELILSYDRQAKVLKKSVAKMIYDFNMQDDNIFDDDFFSNALDKPNPIDLLNKVVYVEYFDEKRKNKKLRIIKYEKLAERIEKGEQIHLENAFPVINNELTSYFGFEDTSADDYQKPNRYTKYVTKIFGFKQKFLLCDEFRQIVPVVDDFTEVSAGKVRNESKQLVFGKKDDFSQNTIDVIPRRGINSGPFEQPHHTNIQVFFILPETHKEQTKELLKMLYYGYKAFKGLEKYIGVKFSISGGFSIVFKNTTNPIPEIEEKLYQRADAFINSQHKLFAFYLTPISKDEPVESQRLVYYKVKELLLKRNVPSQCIETEKMMNALQQDSKNEKVNKIKGTKLRTDSFAYTLQNIAIAVNAKLGGTPWRIAVPKQRELVVGVGAFLNPSTHTKYIGSAFSFDNTGSFNSFEYFQQDELRELAGSIQDAIINYKNTVENPSRLIIHYYKDMSENEVEEIEKALYEINADIPLFVVTINKTESEDFVLFDDAFAEKMPYSGRFVNLGNHTYLLCNNTRYEDNYSRNIEGFPFPVKLKIKCPSDEYLLNQNTVTGLIEQVYQFSRIYWKSVRQQNLPVTIKYPEMVAQIAPHFTGGIIPPNIGKDNLWFL